MKLIRFNTPKGKFQIPLKIVAEKRADYYAIKKGGHSKESPEYKEEVDFVMDDDFEGIDWILNNSNFEDWKENVTKFNDEVNVIDDDFWTSSEGFEIIETQK